MRIVVINTAASSGGAMSILSGFYDYISQNDKINEWFFILSDSYLQETDNIKVIVKKEPKSNWFKRLKWEIIDGAKFINELNADVVLSMQNTISRGLKAPSVIYLQQSLPFQSTKKFSFFKAEERTLAIYQTLIGHVIKNSLKKTNRIIVQSEWMKNALCKIRGINTNEIIVIPPTIDKMPECKESKDCEFKCNNFFYPAAGFVYKNHSILIEAVAELKKQGVNDFQVELTLDESYKEKLTIPVELESNIKFIGSLTREQVFDKYQTSVLVFPSYIETFGLPLLEAKIGNGIVLASNCAFSREILEGYQNGYFFDPFCSNQLVELMKKVINKDITREFNEVTDTASPINSWKKVSEVIYEMKQ